jgi:hypothetical protein
MLDQTRLKEGGQSMVSAPGNALLAAIAVAFAGCASTKPTVLVDPMPPGSAWQDVSLIVTGPAANAKKREICINEARSAGVRLRDGAPAAANLYLDKDNNRLTYGDGRPETMLGPWTAQAVCRVAIAGAIDLDERVKTAANDADISSCRQVGMVRGEDRGAIIPFAFKPVLASQEAAMAAMKLAALRLKANYIALEPISNMMMGVSTSLSFVVAARAFACASAPAPTAKPQRAGDQI